MSPLYIGDPVSYNHRQEPLRALSKAYALFHAFQERRKDRGKGEETNEPDKGDQKLAPKKKSCLRNQIAAGQQYGAGEDHLLTKSMLKVFQIEDEPERIDVIYLDTPARDCLKAGWVSRIRVKEGKPRYTITYKMRYPVQDGDVDSALAHSPR